ncbi:MAG: c-type cytochrome [Verrucomicrobia bacterium]|nr:c-type cytochrome [Verrucomicrobiota bacterium]
MQFTMLPRGVMIFLLVGLIVWNSSAADSIRAPWVTSKVKGRPGPEGAYQIEGVHPKLKFENPVELVAMPGSDLMWMVELRGAIYAFSKRKSDGEKHEVIHLKSITSKFSSVYGLAFHPNFATNRQVFLCYVVGGAEPDGTRVSSFEVTDTYPPRIVAESEKRLMTWKGGGHNGGCLKFGPDGYLYISTGDGSGPSPPDILKTGQDNSDLLASILRIDVDRKDEGLSYGIPDDNPFVKTKNTRPEIWAFGFRNPFKMSFDAELGQLWVGDVGWELWELIFRVEKGGNYGWSIMEGNHEIQPGLKKGGEDFKPPIIDHPHSEAASITGGYVYRGKRIPELRGAYVYGDWETGKIWGLKTEGDRVTWQQELVDTSLKIVTFGEDHEGELYVVDYAGGLFELLPRAEDEAHLPFPTKLSRTGLFENTAKQQMAAGVHSYEIEMQAWENGAIARRWIALPNFSGIEVKARHSVFPANAVILKTLFWPGDGAGEKSVLPIETQMLHYDGQSWNAYAYAWDAEGKDGHLIEKEGQIVTGAEKEMMAGSLINSGDIDYWKFSSRSDCLRCHNSWSGFALGWNSLQLQGTPRAPTAVKSSWKALNQRELVVGRKPRAFKQRKAMTELEYKAKSYLHANCAHCHRENAGGMVNALMYFEKHTQDASLIEASPLRGNFDLADAKVIAPGDPFSSVLYYRMAKSGSGQMPHLGRTRVDIDGLNHIFDWISSMPVNKDKTTNSKDWVLRQIKTILAQEALSEMERDLEKLLGNSQGALGLAYALDHDWLSATQQNSARNVFNDIEPLLSREILSRYFEKKIINPEQIKIEDILKLRPQFALGEQLFFEDPSLQCATCHQLNGKGRAFGPDLTHIARKYSIEQALEHILYPSRTMDPAFEMVTIETELGAVLSGFIIEEGEEQLQMKDIEGNEHRILKSAIVDRQASKLSAMPEGLLHGRSDQEIVDLLGVLGFIKNIR